MILCLLPTSPAHIFTKGCQAFTAVDFALIKQNSEVVQLLKNLIKSTGSIFSMT